MNDCHPNPTKALRRLLLGALLMLPMLAMAQTQSVRFALPTFSAYENGTNAIIVVTRTGGTDGIVTVNYNTVDGSASDVQDYIGASGTLTFGTNEVVKTFTIAVVDNTQQEFDELFQVILSNAVGAVLGDQSTAQVVIFDDDTDIVFSRSSYGVDEAASNAVITILRNPPSQASASVEAFALAGTAAAGLDFTTVATNIVFTNNQAAAFLYVPILNNCDIPSNNVTVSLSLTNPIGARIGAQANATLTITNDDSGAGTIEFVTSGPVVEFEPDTRTLRIPVRRRCASSGAVSVNYRVMNSTNFFVLCHGTTNATAGFDYDMAAGGTFGTLNWAAGDGANKTIDLTINEDLDVELQESILIELIDPPGGGAVLGTNRTFEVQIVDNDLPAGAGDFFYNRSTVDNPSPGANNTVYAIAAYENPTSPANLGKVVLGGDFTAFNAVVRGGVVRLNVDGTLDTTFDTGAGADGFVGAVLVLPDDRVLIAGGFGSVDNISRRGIARLNPNGSLDTAFNPGAGPDGPIFAMSPLQDGRVVIVGDFTTYNNQPRRSIARINADGSLDGTFDPGAGVEGPVYSIVQQADGRVVIGGLFNLVDNVPLSGIARLDIVGALDPAFAPISGADDTIYTLALQTDGRIIAGGAFSTYDGEPRRGIARVNADGTLDNTFNPGAGVDGIVYALDLQRDGRPLIGGDFSLYNGSMRSNVARLYPNGTLDTTFLDNHYNHASPGLNGFVSAVKFLSNSNVLVGGNFTRVGVGFSSLSVMPRENLAGLLGGTTETVGNAPGNFELASATYSVNENVLGGVLTVRVRRLNGALGAVDLPYFTLDGSARDGVDFFGGAGVIRFDDCENLDQFLTIPINDNNTVDGNRTFKIVLGTPQSAGPYVTNSPALGFTSSADVTIVDNDFARGTIGFATAIYSVNENVGTANITVTRTNGSVGRVTVQYATSNGSAVAGVGGDYDATTDTLTFESGQTTKTFPITIRNDTASEFEETVNLRLFNVTGGASLGRSNAVLLINSDEVGAGSISFATNEFSINEAAGLATITLRRTSGSSGKVFVDLFTLDRPPGAAAAREGVDYTGVTNTIAFQAGETVQTITIPILADGLVEGNEFLNLVLTNVTGGANLGYLSSSALKIVDDDFYGSLAFTDANLYVNEQDGSTEITVVRTGGSAEEVSADFVLTMGTATEGVDYVLTNGTLVFPDGSLSQTFSIPIQNDGQLEINETIVLTLTNFAKASLGSITEAVLTIVDDEALAAPAGSVDTFFDPNPGPNNFVNAIALLNDGRLFAAGDFTVFNDIVRRRIARLHPDGSVDTSFNPGSGADNTISAIAVQPDEKVVVAGRFTRMGNRNRNGIARLNPNGGVDTSFNPGSGADNPVLAVALDNDGTILIGGDFTTYNNTARSRVARLTPSGSLDSGFNPGNGANGAVQAIAVQPDGKVIVAGDFSEFNTQPANFIVRLQPNGARDPSFQAAAGPNGFVHTVALQPDGKIVIAGAFTAVGGVPRVRIARLNSDGTLDTGFDPGAGADDDVFALALQPDGKIIVAGEFTRIGGVNRNRIARLNANGSLDLSINFGSGANSFILAAVLQPDEQILIGGGFTEVNGFPRNYIARLIGGSDLGPGTLEFSAADYVVTEGNTNVAVQILRSGGTTGQLNVDFLTANGTATATKDYQALSTNVTFLDGESVKTVLVRVLDDTFVEDNETVLLALTNIVGEGTLGAQSSSTITIVNDDARVGFSLATLFVNENVVGGRATIVIERVGTTNGTVTVDFTTQTNGTATINQDFSGISTTVVFAPGVTNRTVTVPIFEDAIVEGTETIPLALSNLTGPGTLSIANAVLNIIDNDFNNGNLTFAAPQFSASEGNGTVTVTLLRTNGTTGVVSVDYTTQNGTALAGQDYVGSSGRVTFGDGQSVATFTISLLDDVTIEGNENFQIVLSNPTGGAVISGPSVAPGIIEENDFGPGSLAADFNPGAGANGRVRSIALAPDGKVIVGGTFTTFDNTNRTNIARMNIDGSHDLSFDPGAGPNSIVSAVGAISDGRVLVGGSFTTFNGATFRRVARLTTNGAPDASFNGLPTFNAAVNSLATHPNDRVAVGGGFTTPRARIAQLLLNGSEDTSFNPGTGADNIVHSVVTAPGGFVVIGGAFTRVDTIATKRVARLSPAGLVDSAFVVDAITNGAVLAVAVQSDGKVVAAGTFMTSNSSDTVTIARFNNNGSLDTSFDPGAGANGPIYAVGIQRSGKIIIGGDFTLVDGRIRNRYARLLANGALDSTFDPGTGADNTVFSIVMLPDDNALIGGDFTSVTGVPRGGVAKIRANDRDSRISGIQHLGFEVRVSLSCTPGVNYILDTSSDLVNWAPWRTNIAVGSLLEFIDTNVNSQNQKFYRARQAGF